MEQYDLIDRLVEAGNGYLRASVVHEHDISKYTMMKNLKT